MKCAVLDAVLQRLHLPTWPISWSREILLARLSSAVVGHVASATLLYDQSHHNGILRVALGPCQWLWGPGEGAWPCCNSIPIGGVKTNTASGASAGEMIEDVGSGWMPLPGPFVS